MSSTMTDYLDLAGQLMMVRLFDTELDADTDAFLRTHKIGGVCLFRQNMVDAAQLTRFTGALVDAMGPRALVALDQEGGAVCARPGCRRRRARWRWAPRTIRNWRARSARRWRGRCARWASTGTSRRCWT
jgi:hypothetical protein